MFNTNRIVILGALIDHVDRQGALIRISKMIETFPKKPISRYVATVNSDFLANMLGWSFDHPKNLELMRILRQSDLSTPDGMPLVWLAKWLDCPLTERVTGQDLFPEIADMLAKNNKRLFLLGGTHKIAWEAAEALKVNYPGLQIAGVDQPFIHIQGEWLENTFAQDALLVENINNSKPDLLFLQLGNPKQELLFDRIRNQLRVPVTVGIGGSFERFTGKVPRAPIWMQRTGLEWFQRLLMEPGRLWKRYVIDFCKLVYFGTPLIFFHHLNKLFSTPNSSRPLHNSLFLAPEKTITVIPLPPRLDKLAIGEIKNLIEEAFDFDAIVLDFRHVDHIDPNGAALLVDTWMLAQKREKELYALKIKWRVRWLLRLHHVWGYLSDRVCGNVREIIARLQDGVPIPKLFESVIQIPPFIFISFFGELDNQQDYGRINENLDHLIHDRIPVVDLTYCISIENLGWSFLMKLCKHKDNLALIGMNATVKRQLREVNLEQYFRFFNSKEEFLADY